VYIPTSFCLRPTVLVVWLSGLACYIRSVNAELYMLQAVTCGRDHGRVAEAWLHTACLIAHNFGGALAGRNIAHSNTTLSAQARATLLLPSSFVTIRSRSDTSRSSVATSPPDVTVADSRIQQETYE